MSLYVRSIFRPKRASLVNIIDLGAQFVVLSIDVAGQTSSVGISVPASNAGDLVGLITVVTTPAGHGTHTPIILSGTDASRFAITNNGVLPCNLIVGASNIAAGTYSISLTAS